MKTIAFNLIFPMALLSAGLTVPAPTSASTFVARPSGYQVVPTQNSPGAASFRAEVDRTAQTISYQLQWNNLRGNITQSHIHFGRQATNGDILLFLCTNLGNTPASATPAPLCGESTSGTVTGVLHASDIVALPFGGIQPENQLLPFASFDELANAIEAHATYVVVHTLAQPPGELRGQIPARSEDAMDGHRRGRTHGG